MDPLNTGHGHVFPRPDGVRARCGGPGLCAECSRDAAKASARGREVQIGVIRKWPDGMPARVEHVWRDLVGFTIDYKLLDLQRVLAEFGFELTITERAQSATQPPAPPTSHPGT